MHPPVELRPVTGHNNRIMNRKNYIFISIAVILGNLFLDRITKVLASDFLKGEGVKSYLAGFFKMIFIENTGAFLSMGDRWPLIFKYLFLIIIPAGFCLYGIYYCFLKTGDQKFNIILSTIIGGGIGNLLDRIFYDFHVIDFLNFGIGSLRTGILNFADLSVTFGAVFFIIYEYKYKREDKIAL